MPQTDILKTEEKAILALRSLYRSYGYVPYKMSKFEEFEYYIQNKDFLVSDRFITFNDTNGKLLALKPDVTLSIIKTCSDQPGCKQKVCYNENIYRVSDSTRQFREIMQTGLECIGHIGLYDIFETVFLAAESLRLISEEFVLQISHLGILSSLLDGISPDPGFRREAARYIAEKNAHDLTRLCAVQGIPPENTRLLTDFLSACGPRDRVLAQLEPLCRGSARKALEELTQLSRLLDTIPHSDRIIFDFSVINDMNYYSGIVFKGFLNGISSGILAGGQYDNLMKKMERRSGAIGFALYLDLLEQLPAPRKGFDVDVVLLCHPQDDPGSIARAVSRLVAQGKTVSVQQAIPAKLRCREILHLGEEDTLC